MDFELIQMYTATVDGLGFCCCQLFHNFYVLRVKMIETAVLLVQMDSATVNSLCFGCC